MSVGTPFVNFIAKQLEPISDLKTGMSTLMALFLECVRDKSPVTIIKHIHPHFVIYAKKWGGVTRYYNWGKLGVKRKVIKKWG